MVIEVIIKIRFPYEENEWRFYFWNPTVALYMYEEKSEMTKLNIEQGYRASNQLPKKDFRLQKDISFFKAFGNINQTCSAFGRNPEKI